MAMRPEVLLRCGFLCIILRLRVPQLLVLPLLLRQFLMAAPLHQPALMEDSSIVAELTAGKPVADEDRRLVLHNLLKILVNSRLYNWTAHATFRAMEKGSRW